MITLKIDASGLKGLEKQLDKMAAKLPLAIARGLNEGGRKVRTKVQHALQKQTSLVKYSSVTSRVRTARGFAGQGDTSSVAKGSGVGQGISYQIIVSGKPATKPREFKTTVKLGPGGGVTIVIWQSPQVQAVVSEATEGGLRARLGKERFPIRGFDGPTWQRRPLRTRPRPLSSTPWRRRSPRRSKSIWPSFWGADDFSKAHSLSTPAIPVEAVNALAAVLARHGLTRLEIDSGALRVRLERPPIAAPSAPAQAAPSASSGEAGEDGAAVSSRMVGVAYLRPGPDAAPFVEVGSIVEAGDSFSSSRLSGPSTTSSPRAPERLSASL